MPALYPMLPDVDALLKNTNIEFRGQSIPLWNMIQMLTALNSMTEIEGIWNVTTRFNLGISLGDNSYKNKKRFFFIYKEGSVLGILFLFFVRFIIE